MVASRWMTVKTQTMLGLVAILLIFTLPLTAVFVYQGLDTGWVLLFIGLSLIYLFVFGLLFFKVYRHIWKDTSKKYRMSFNPAQDSLERALSEANLTMVRRKNRRVMGRPRRACDVEYDVRSEGLRIGVDRHYDNVMVYLGPVGEFNSKEINRMKDLIDGALG